jgi:hypothetical protein
MSCSSHQSLVDSDKRIREEWKRLDDKANKSESENGELRRLARASGESSQAVRDHITDCPESKKKLM